jgi:AhpC/TSA family
MAGGDDGPLGFAPDDEDAAAQEARRQRLARRQDPDLVAEGRRATGEPQGQPRARLPAGASRYGWFIGVVGVLVIVLITLNTFRSTSSGPGSKGVPRGRQAPPFAAPLALGSLDGDVNVAVRRGQGDAGNVPACSVRGPQVLNACALWEQGPVVLAFFATRGAGCVAQLDLLDQVAARHPQVRFAAISIRGDRNDLRRTIRARRWRFPVGYDADGVLANAYGVAVCPQITFLRQGGRVADTSLGELSAAALEQRVRRLDP